MNEIKTYDIMERNKHMTIEVPNWCIIGKFVKWKAPHITGNEWVKEEILSYGIDGFFHGAHNCPVYYTKFSEYEKTIKEVNE